MLKISKILLSVITSVSCLNASNKQIDYNNTNLLEMYCNNTIGKTIKNTCNVPIFNVNNTADVNTINNDLLNNKRERTDNTSNKKYRITKEHVVPQFIKKFYLEQNLFNELNTFLADYIDKINNIVSRNTKSNVKKIIYMSKPHFYGKWLQVKTKEDLKNDCLIEINAVLKSNNQINNSVPLFLNNLYTDIDNNKIQSIVNLQANNNYKSLIGMINGDATISKILEQFFEVYKSYDQNNLLLLKNIHYNPSVKVDQSWKTNHILYAITNKNNPTIKINKKEVKLSKLMSLNITENGREYYVAPGCNQKIANKYIQKDVFNQLWHNNFHDNTNIVNKAVIKNSKNYANAVSLLLLSYLERLTKNLHIVNNTLELNQLCKKVDAYITKFYPDINELEQFKKYILDFKATKNYRINNDGTITGFSRRFRPRVSHLINNNNVINDSLNIEEDNELILPTLVEKNNSTEPDDDGFIKPFSKQVNDDIKLKKPILIEKDNTMEYDDAQINNITYYNKRNNIIPFGCNNINSLPINPYIQYYPIPPMFNNGTGIMANFPVTSSSFCTPINPLMYPYIPYNHSRKYRLYKNPMLNKTISHIANNQEETKNITEIERSNNEQINSKFKINTMQISNNNTKNIKENIPPKINIDNNIKDKNTKNTLFKDIANNNNISKHNEIPTNNAKNEIRQKAQEIKNSSSKPRIFHITKTKPVLNSNKTQSNTKKSHLFEELKTGINQDATQSNMKKSHTFGEFKNNQTTNNTSEQNNKLITGNARTNKFNITTVNSKTLVNNYKIQEKSEHTIINPINNNKTNEINIQNNKIVKDNAHTPSLFQGLEHYNTKNQKKEKIFRIVKNK